ncbi:hypothetical protein [Nocardiopsis sp. LOL_012]|uniref:hypothetical protein n=1 Tax=Nocardiopsis sp. LOL_012 TaxID=3345409 RepID=UPI003A840B2D
MSTEARARTLDELIAGRWIVSFDVDAQGERTYFAVRPVGWNGPGDPFERVEAPTHAGLYAALARRCARAGGAR